jgi:hypothetical protein
MKKTALRTLLLLCCMAAVDCRPRPKPLPAPPLALPANQPVWFKVDNLEQVNPFNNLAVPGYADAAGQQGRWGVFNVSVLQHAVVTSPHVDISGGGAIFFADDGPGGSAGQITGIFYGIQYTSATTSYGGTIDFFWHDKNATHIANTCVSGGSCAPTAATVALFTSGTFLARVKLANGIDPASPVVFTQSNVGVPPPAGFGQTASFANVDTTKVGPWTAALDGDWFTTSFGTRDMRLTTVFTNLPSWAAGPAGTVGLRSNDPFRVFTH